MLLFKKILWLDLLILQNSFVVHKVPGTATIICKVSVRDDVETYYQQHGGCYRAFWQQSIFDQIKPLVRPESEVHCTQSSADFLQNDWSPSLLRLFAFFPLLCVSCSRGWDGSVNWCNRKLFFFFFLFVDYFSMRTANHTNSPLGHLVGRSKASDMAGSVWKKQCKSRTTPFEGYKCNFVRLDVTSNYTRVIKLSSNSQWTSAWHLNSALCSHFLASQTNIWDYFFLIISKHIQINPWWFDHPFWGLSCSDCS